MTAKHMLREENRKGMKLSDFHARTNQKKQYCLTIKLTGGQKRSFWTSSERSERQLSALLYIFLRFKTKHQTRNACGDDEE